ncbi:hypothetical protein L0152_02915 [bacterium]|nr:hypothetical protein [bacterium]
MFKTLQYFFGLFVLMVLCTYAGAGTLSRLHLFEPGAVIFSSEVNEEFQQIIDAFSGVSTTKYLWVKNSSSSEPAGRFDQLGSANVAEFKVGGTTKVSINNMGQLVSAVTTLAGAPFTVASTTKVTNLNCDLVDGLDFSGGFSSPLTITGTTPTLLLDDTDSGDENFNLRTSSDAFLIENVGVGTDLFTIDEDGDATFLGDGTGTNILTISNPGGHSSLRFSTNAADSADMELFMDATTPRFKLRSLDTTYTFLSAEPNPAGTAGVVTVNGIQAYGVQEFACIDNGTGSNATCTLNPTGSFVHCNCSDAQACDITMGETGPPPLYSVVTIISTGGSACNFADTAGVSELAGSFAAGARDVLTLIYDDDRFVELHRSNN